ncbi:MAG: hypothetical protein ACJ77K_13850 [Bacteroidia bacterium]
MKTILKMPVILGLCGLASCTNDSEMNRASVPAGDSVKMFAQVPREVLDNMMQALPQPIEIAKIISSSKVEIGKSLLIPSENAGTTAERNSQALLLGGYGVDLGYIDLTGKTIYMIEYLESVKKLAAGLKVDQFFDFGTLSRLAASKEDADSLVQLSTDNFNRIDAYLRDANRGEQSVLILVGAWLEGTNLFANMYDESGSADIAKRIGEQKVVFDNIYLIVQKFDGSPYFKHLETSLGTLRNSYDKVKITYVYKKPVMTEVNGQLVLKDQTEMHVDYEESELRNIITEIRKVRSEYFLTTRSN